MSFSLRHLLYAGVAAAAIAAGALDIIAKKTDLFDLSIPVHVRDSSGELRTLQAPVYNSRKVPPFNCSGYFRRAANDVFDLDYSVSDAWNRIYIDDVVAIIGTRSLEELASDRILKPGMGIGVYNPRSSRNGTLDMKGKPIAYSHNMLYLGENESGEMIFLHQLGEDTYVFTSTQMKKANLHPRFVIAAKSR